MADLTQRWNLAFDGLLKRGDLAQLVRMRTKALGNPEDPNLPTAKQEYLALLERHRGKVSVHSLQVLVRGQYPGYVTQAAAWLEDEMHRYREESGLMRGGLCAGNVDAPNTQRATGSGGQALTVAYEYFAAEVATDLFAVATTASAWTIRSTGHR